LILTVGNGHNRGNSEDRRHYTVPEMQSLLQTIDRPIMAVADLKIRARTKLNIELIKEYIRARRLNPRTNSDERIPS